MSDFKIGETIVAKAKRRMMRHVGRIVQMDDESITITNGRETVHIRLWDWEVKAYAA